jgi:threonine/homoserine/homoserine lactone efflux protein
MSAACSSLKYASLEMTPATFLALFTFAFVTSITPGPNNMMLFASGVNFGFRRTIPHMLGIGSGFFTLLLGVGFGLGAFLETLPLLHTVLKIAGGAYLLYIAWHIAASRDIGEAAAGARPMTFLEAAAFQWVNPKAWVMALGAMAAYPDPQNYAFTVVIIAAVFAIVNIPSVSCWAGFGSLLRNWLSVPPRLKWFNITMGALLALSLWPMLR